jgi:hypothetical protein
MVDEEKKDSKIVKNLKKAGTYSKDFLSDSFKPMTILDRTLWVFKKAIIPVIKTGDKVIIGPIKSAPSIADGILTVGEKLSGNDEFNKSGMTSIPAFQMIKTLDQAETKGNMAPLVHGYRIADLATFGTFGDFANNIGLEIPIISKSEISPYSPIMIGVFLAIDTFKAGSEGYTIVSQELFAALTKGIDEVKAGIALGKELKELEEDYKQHKLTKEELQDSINKVCSKIESHKIGDASKRWYKLEESSEVDKIEKQNTPNNSKNNTKEKEL